VLGHQAHRLGQLLRLPAPDRAALRQLDRRQQISQSDMSRRIGRPQSYISRIYRGEGTQTTQDLQVFARALATTVTKLTSAAEDAYNEAVQRGEGKITDMIW